MRRAPWLAVSLLGVSCAAPEGALFGVSAPRRPRAPAAKVGTAALVGRATMGSLGVGKWRLDNGLEVILAPDPSATSVSYTTWFRVGSRHENAALGETGLAHLFEHLMFTQTRNAAANAFDDKMDAVGGSTNAMTYYDFTAYVDDIPSTEMNVA